MTESLTLLAIIGVFVLFILIGIAAVPPLLYVANWWLDKWNY